MTQQKTIEEKIANLEKEQKHYSDAAVKANQTLEQAKLLAFSCQEKIAVLKDLLEKKQPEETDA